MKNGYFCKGIRFGFENGVQIGVKIKDFRFIEKKNDHLWDINQCILENAASIEEIGGEPRRFDTMQNVRIEYILRDSILIKDNKYDKYREHGRQKMTADSVLSLVYFESS